MNTHAIVLPEPRVPISIRVATLADVAFIDKLQKLHNHAVGWMPTASLEGKIRGGHVIIAEENVACVYSHTEAFARGEDGVRVHTPYEDKQSVSEEAPSLTRKIPVGYCMGNDQYFKRDDVGIVYQINIEPGRQRGLIGATLLQYMFEKSAYGCRLFCCWCAQDLAANKFWEAMGFVPLAYRAGGDSKGKLRIHIFWQKRIQSGDSSTPYWFPAKTTGGALQSDRIVLPIPPGVHWSAVKDVIMPTLERREVTKALPGVRAAKKKVENDHPSLRGKMWFADQVPQVEKPKPEKRKKVKNDPKFVAAARELRDRWLEQVNSGNVLLTSGKYDVGKESSVESSVAIEGVVVNRMIAA